jgi:hypothetical protein
MTTITLPNGRTKLYHLRVAFHISSDQTSSCPEGLRLRLNLPTETANDVIKVVRLRLNLPTETINDVINYSTNMDLART